MKMFEVYAVQDIIIEKANGSYVWDSNGERYLDMYGGHAVISIGHTNQYWVQRIEKQLHTIAFYSNSVKIPMQEELAELFGRVSGKENYQLFLCNSGAEANENALKLASFYNNRKKVVAFSNSFHGRTSLTVAATDNPKIVAPVNETTNVVFLPFNNTQALTEYFTKHGDEVSSIIIEGIQGVGGINEASVEFLQTIRTLCTQYGAVYIADSVQCGYGRTGTFFSHDYAGVEADIYSVAKGMGNGFPIGGIVVAPHFKPVLGMLGTTFGGNHLACAAALAVLEVLEKQDLVTIAKQRGEYLQQQLQTIPQLQSIRGRGLMIGFDVPAELKPLRNNLLHHGKVFTGEAKPNVIRLLPSLCISESEIDECITAIKNQIHQLQ